MGQIGSGKKTLAKWIASQLHTATYILPDVKVETVRQMIDYVYRSTDSVVVVIPDADGMNVAAKNALLKVIEEPPKNVHFIITVESEANMLDTILSRSAVYRMDLYTRDEILRYYRALEEDGDADLVSRLCDTPGEVKLLLAQSGGVKSFNDYVLKVVDNIALVSGSNSFKIAEKIALKDEVDKYDLHLFWKAFISVCLDRLAQSPFQYAYGIQTTAKYLQDIKNPAINKQMSFDNWLLEIREDWMEYAES